MRTICQQSKRNHAIQIINKQTFTVVLDICLFGFKTTPSFWIHEIHRSEHLNGASESCLSTRFNHKKRMSEQIDRIAFVVKTPHTSLCNFRANTMRNYYCTWRGCQLSIENTMHFSSTKHHHFIMTRFFLFYICLAFAIVRTLTALQFLLYQKQAKHSPNAGMRTMAPTSHPYFMQNLRIENKQLAHCKYQIIDTKNVMSK